MPGEIAARYRSGRASKLALNRHMDFDSHRYLKLLCRLGFLRKEAGAGMANYSRTDSWPPPAAFFKGTRRNGTY